MTWSTCTRNATSSRRKRSAMCARARAIRTTNVIIDLINVASHMYPTDTRTTARRSHEDDSRRPFSCGSTIFIPPRHYPAVVHSMRLSLSPLLSPASCAPRPSFCSRESLASAYFGEAKVEGPNGSHPFRRPERRVGDGATSHCGITPSTHGPCNAYDYLIVNFSWYYASARRIRNLDREGQPLHRY